MTISDDVPKICDYEGSNYRTDFWEGRGRDYEDRVERIAIRRLLPTSGKRLVEIGAAFGRLTNEWDGYEQVVVLDYSFSQLQYAQEHYGRDGRFIYVAANAYQMPLKAGVCDVATIIRVLHHMANVPAIFGEVRRILAPNSAFLLEYANKRNIKAMIRYALRRQDWNPYDLAPVEFVELNFDFHPRYIAQELTRAGFQTKKRLPLSFFRLGALKRLPTGLLVGLDALLQNIPFFYTPSIFTLNRADTNGENALSANTPEALFQCPQTGEDLIRQGDEMVAVQSGLRYAIRDGIYDFKAPLS